MTPEELRKARFLVSDVVDALNVAIRCWPGDSSPHVSLDYIRDMLKGIVRRIDEQEPESDS